MGSLSMTPNKTSAPGSSRRRARALVASLTIAAVALAPTYAFAGRTVTIKGGGWGHGIGMSQYGAYGRALNGKSAEEIVKHYYSGIDLAERDMPPIRVGLLQGRSGIAFTSSALSDGG